MSTIRNSRTRLLTAAAGVALAALSLTACNGDGTGVNDEGAAPASSSAATSSPSAAASESAASSTGSNPDAGSSSSGKGSGGSDSQASGGQAGGQASGAQATGGRSKPTAKAPGSSGKPVTCDGSNTKTVAAPVARPVNHMLLTVTNTGSVPCYLYYYPAVQFGEAQSVPPVVEDSQPQAVVTLDPGRSGYAGVLLSATDGSGGHGHTEKSLKVHFFGKGGPGSGSVGKAATPSLPSQGVYVDDSIRVTYWQQDMGDALTW
ncbi:DUF4232 domain-containing protein [Streptomyces thermocoprophilus]|uniref:DUF4232 domain-containing protein n=1 Tax=Streptomyces thermocoprophilus TaxID=78356 RepID=A0ABV5VGG3_9ACTN